MSSSTETIDEEEEKKEKAWREALKKRGTLDLLQQRRHTGDIVQLWDEERICYTTVGQIRGRQVLMLESGWEESCGWGCLLTYPGCIDHQTVIHELMHKVGLWHEQMRYDRDKYIKIHWENIIPGLENQFGKIGRGQSTTYNLPYDYKSVMQYKKNAGARKENLVTMETIDKRYTDIIGNSKDASPEDYKKICSIYKCNKCMGKKFKPLRNRRRK
uniref:Metalloendopeptidase n=1 Tax=Meloidogyne hapla TaxID=6305 RepID=A0A1I8BRS6_MELHA